MARALYRKYRSRKLADVVGQKHVTDILERSLAAGRIAHAYLLTGPRGVGKTSIARILAHEINHLPYDEDSTHLDIIEIDAASNNGVEDVRDLREKVQIAPVSSPKKVYIIDEVHMLSKAAFNALLKTLEEPPEHAVFILATTDVDKLPATIISRTQRYSFHSIGLEDAVNHLKFIAEKEGIKIDDDALELIARRGDGSFRDSISLLDQLSSLAGENEEITKALIEQSLGLAPSEHVAKLLEAYENKDIHAIVALIDEGEKSGIQPSVLISQLIETVREQIADKPQLLPLLDQLLDVSKSPQPALKLLTTLAAHITPKPKSAALVSPPAEVSAPVKELEKLATTSPAPQTIPSQNGFAPGLTRVPTSGQSRAADVLTQEGSSELSGSSPARVASGGVGKGEQNSDTNANLQALDWNAVVEYAREHFVAIYSVLSKCSYEIANDKLIIYTVNNFYKKKLDDAKYRINLAKALEETGVGNPLIETISTPPPPKDSTAAAVAAIMGGGEEVSVDA